MLLNDTSLNDLEWSFTQIITLLLVTSASDLLVHTIRFCHTHDLSWLCIVRRRWLYRAWRLVVEYPQYTTSVTTCKMVADVTVVHQRPCLQHLACCIISSRHIGSESRFLPTPPAFDAPVRGVPVGISPSRLVRKTRIVWLPDGEKNSKICLFVLTQLANGQTDRHRMTA